MTKGQKLLGVAAGMYLLLMVAGASFNAFYSKWGFRDGVESNSLESYLNGTTMRPFAYRRLLPDLASAAENFTPPEIRARAVELLDRPDGSTWLPIDGKLHAKKIYSFRFLLMYGMTFVSTVLMIIAAYAFAKTQGYSRAACFLGAASFALIFPLLQSKGGYFYDFTEAAFLLIFLKLAWHRQIFWMLVVSALAAWNKESFLFFVPLAYPFLRRHFQGWRGAALALVACMLVAGTVYLIQRFRFQMNAGGAAEFHLLEQMKYFGTLRFLVSPTMAYGVPMPHPLSAVGLAAMALIWRQARPGLSAEAKHHFALAALVNVPLFLLFCYPGEVRNLSFLFPSLVLLLVGSSSAVITAAAA